MTEPIEGWHLDPDGSERLRYYDGANWTEQVRPLNRPIAEYRAAERAEQPEVEPSHEISWPPPRETWPDWKVDPAHPYPLLRFWETTFYVRYWDGQQWTDAVQQAPKAKQFGGCWVIIGALILFGLIVSAIQQILGIG